MQDDDPLNLEEFRGRIQNEDRVPCARCGRPIASAATRCPHCSVHFSGIAYDFTPGANDLNTRRDRLRRVTAWILFGICLLIAIVALTGWLMQRASA